MNCGILIKKLKVMEIKKLETEPLKENCLKFNSKTRKYIPIDESRGDEPPFERCIELKWLHDKIDQIKPDPNTRLFDFGCNKAKYIGDVKDKYNMVTAGIDMKAQGSSCVDEFYRGEFNDNHRNMINETSPYLISTSISSVEHSGCKMHPDKKRITEYQYDICKFLCEISQYFLLTTPFGKRPGWAKDKSRTNLYQFNCDMLDLIKNIADEQNKSYLEEIYILDNGFWRLSDREEARNCSYRDEKSGASAVSLMCIYN